MTTLKDWWRSKRTPVHEVSAASGGWIEFFGRSRAVKSNGHELPEDSRIVPLGKCERCQKSLVRNGEICARCLPPSGRHVVAGKIVTCERPRCPICDRGHKVLPLKRGGK